MTKPSTLKKKQERKKQEREIRARLTQKILHAYVTRKIPVIATFSTMTGALKRASIEELKQVCRDHKIKIG